MKPQDALAAIKTLRDQINDVADPTEGLWRNQVCYHLDQASDVIEFPGKLKCWKHGEVTEACATCDCIHGAV